MIAAAEPIQRAAGAKLLVLDHFGIITHRPRRDFNELLLPGDLVVANDAATLPASLQGVHLASGSAIEVRLAGRPSLAVEEVKRFTAVLFGPGDFHMRTEDRPLPPKVTAGDRLGLGPLSAVIAGVLNHPRLVELEFEGAPDEIWEGLAHHGHPIQYSHISDMLALWDVWTPISGSPAVAFEPPSAGFVLDWQFVARMRIKGVRFATLTHAAGVSSTGDPELDARLPFDEPYLIPGSSARLITEARSRGSRVIAIGTTVVRALESAATPEDGVRVGQGIARMRIGRTTRLRVVDAILSGTHEPETSHYELLRAFADEPTLARVTEELEANHYRTHEFGDSIFMEVQESRKWKAESRKGLAPALCFGSS